MVLCARTTCTSRVKEGAQEGEQRVEGSETLLRMRMGRQKVSNHFSEVIFSLKQKKCLSLRKK